MDKKQAAENVHKAINDLFAIRPSISTREARALLKQFQQDIDIMLEMVDVMEKLGVPPDSRVG